MGSILLQTVRANISSIGGDKKVRTRMLLESGSQRTYLTSNVRTLEYRISGGVGISGVVGKILKIIKRGGISGVVGKNVKCEHSNVVINVAYSKLKLQLHFRVTFFVVVSTDFSKN